MASESEIEYLLQATGWRTQHGGWPDFLCWREVHGRLEVACVEVKDENTGDALRAHQVEVHRILRALGIPVFVAQSAGDLAQIQAAPIKTDLSLAERLAAAERALLEMGQRRERRAEVLSINDAAKRLGLSRSLTTRIFECEPGIICVTSPESMHKRRYSTRRIPAAVFERVYHRLSISEGADAPYTPIRARKKTKAALTHPNKARTYSPADREKLSAAMKESYKRRQAKRHK